MDTFAFARSQMTLSLVFHMVFAAIGIGLPLMMVIAETLYLRTGRDHYKALAKKWAKGAGLLFAIGAVSGTALSLELGLLWPKYMEVIGATVGHIFGLEGFAFFIEAIFLALYLYGWDKLAPKAHLACGIVVAFAGALSGILVLGVNAWMQIPVGVTFNPDGSILVNDPIAIFKNPAWANMAIHSTISCYQATAFAVASIYAAAWLRGRRDAYVAAALKLSMAVSAVVAIAQPLSGDILAKFVYETQPVKFAAMEGQYATERRAPLRIGGWPDDEAGITRYAIEIPGGLSFLAKSDFNAEVVGLNAVPRDRRPNVHIVHLAFQIMVGLGTAMMLLAIWFWIAWWRKRIAAFDSRWLLRAIQVSGSFGFIALEAGWVVTEAGRMPWVIQGVMLAKNAITGSTDVPLMFGLFTLLYLLLGWTTVSLLRRLARGGKDEPTAPQEVGMPAIS